MKRRGGKKDDKIEKKGSSAEKSGLTMSLTGRDSEGRQMRDVCMSVCVAAHYIWSGNTVACLINYEISSAILGSQSTDGKEFPIAIKSPLCQIIKSLFMQHFIKICGFSNIYKLFTRSSCTKPDFYDSQFERLPY